MLGCKWLAAMAVDGSCVGEWHESLPFSQLCNSSPLEPNTIEAPGFELALDTHPCVSQREGRDVIMYIRVTGLGRDAGGSLQRHTEQPLH